MRLKGIDEATTMVLRAKICCLFREFESRKAGIKTLILGKIYLFAMQNINYSDFCLVVIGFYITFASEYIFYIKLVMDNVAIYKK